MAGRIDRCIDDGLVRLNEKASTITAITLDFAKKNVDYLAVTGHEIDKNW